MMNRDYGRRHQLMTRASSGYLRMAISGSRESIDEDLDDASSDAGSIRSTTSVRSYKSWKRQQRLRRRRAPAPLERAQSLFGDASSDQQLHFNANRNNMDPFSFGVRRTPLPQQNRAPLPTGYRPRLNESSSSVDYEVPRDQEPLGRDVAAEEAFSHQDLSTIQQSPLEPYYSSSSLDSSSSEEEDREDLVPPPLPRGSADQKDTRDWLLTGSFKHNQEVVKPVLPVVIPPRKIIVAKSKDSKKNKEKIMRPDPMAGGLNELLDIIDPEEKMNGMPDLDEDLERPDTPTLVDDADDGKKLVPNGIARNMEDVTGDNDDVFKPANLASQLAESDQIASTPNDVRPPSLNESEIQNLPGIERLQNSETEANGISSNSDVRIYSIQDLAEDSGAADHLKREERPLRQEEITDASSLPGSGVRLNGHAKRTISPNNAASPDSPLLIQTNPTSEIREVKSPTDSPSPTSRSPKENRYSRNSDDYFRHSHLEVVMEEDDSAGEGSESSSKAPRKPQDAFTEKIDELKRDLTDNDIYGDAKAECDGGEDTDEVRDDACDLLLNDDEVSGSRRAANGTSSAIESTLDLDSTANHTDVTQSNGKEVVNHAPSNGAHVRKKIKSIPLTTSDKSALCGCCSIM